MPYATIDGTRFFYKDIGAGPPIVLVPGLAGDSTAYNVLIPELRKRARIIAPDPRGLGQSEGARDDLSTHLLADDLRGLLDHLEIQRASLLGTSLGAIVVRRFAVQYPHRVDRLILCAAGLGKLPYARRIRDLIQDLISGIPPERLMKHLFTLILSPEFLDENDEFIGWMEELLTPDADRLRVIERQAAMLNAETQEDMGAVDAPVLIMAGAKDQVVPLHHAKALQRSLSGSRLLVLEGAAHHPFLEAQQEALDGLIAFLEADEEGGDCRHRGQ